MITTLILVCTLAAAPEARLCDRNNATRVLELPEQTALPQMCLKFGQEFLAQTAFHDMAPGEYPKVMCIRTKPANVG